MHDTFGPVVRVISLRRSIFDQIERSESSEWRLFSHAAARYVLLPNSLCGEGDHIETWWFEQLDCFSTRLVTSIFAPSEPKTECECDHWQRDFDVRQQVAFEEDFPMRRDPGQSVLRGHRVRSLWTARAGADPLSWRDQRRHRKMAR